MSRPLFTSWRPPLSLALAVLCAGGLFPPAAVADRPPCPIRLTDVTRETGITFVHTDGSSGKRYIVETVCCGLALFDYDRDGDIDIYFLNGAPLKGTKVEGPLPRNSLWRNEGGWKFTDVTEEAGVGDTGYGLGVAVGDYDNDGDRDIFVACGHLQDNVELYDDLTSYHVRNIVFMNDGRGKFMNVSDRCGDGLKVKLSSRGAGFDDLDNDGDVDVVILNSRREPTILRNDSRTGNHWLEVELQGVKSNRDGIGAHVKVFSGDLVLLDEVHSGAGYQSHFGLRLYFGLGKRERVDRIEVRWIGGGVDVVSNVPVDHCVYIVEGSGKAIVKW